MPSRRKYHTAASKPTAKYLRACAKTDIPNASARKLVILDLNGTLLFRSQSQRGSSRTVYTRPYMPSFREYLFHSETRSWLDTMIWSSAQPHNVAIMVQACFGSDKDKLIQIWARDRMKLDESSYNQKVQTIKDLDQVWQHSKTTSSLPQHSVYSTVLFDDSMKKAVLQPYNHIALKEYDNEMRRKDFSLTSSSSHPLTVLDKHDTSLLALVGILEDLRSQENVAKWIKDGHIIPQDAQAPSSIDKWFESDHNMQHWTLKGRNALDRLGILIQANVK
ncbi:hypothetical protein M378DRAFT_14082 [Amanita muscaria Koide BX008]|uniref:Mitochondrial import inner membrane translocase subunit TIM50 n=1 Tax=Amanita muscaria (strain Koide BX008) TaxID=946122 RepID=A0A0C2T247_AMAMK|nr:hypothetical protein M378DRAFT_14082 [Amanita muscaria Koide BX008]